MNTDESMQPDEPVFPEVIGALEQAYAGVALPATARARHLYALRAHAAELGVPQGVEQGVGLGVGQDAEAAAGAGVAGKARGRLRGLSALRGRRAATAMGAWLTVMTLGSGVAVAASGDALPGDALYGVKRAVEQVRLALPADTAGEITRRLALADRRFDEAAALGARGADAALIARAIGDADELLGAAAELAEDDVALAELVATAGERAHERLTLLIEGGLPAEAATQARAALERARGHAGGPGSTGPQQASERTPDHARPSEAGAAASSATGDGEHDGPGQSQGSSAERGTSQRQEAQSRRGASSGQGVSVPSEASTEASAAGQGSDAGQSQGSSGQDPPGQSAQSAAGQGSSGAENAAERGGGSAAPPGEAGNDRERPRDRGRSPSTQENGQSVQSDEASGRGPADGGGQGGHGQRDGRAESGGGHGSRGGQDSGPTE